MLFLGKFHEHSHGPWHQSRNYRRASFALCRANPQTIWFQKHGPLKDVISEDAPLPRGSIFGMTGMWAKWPAVTPTLFGALAFHGFQVREMLGNAARELAECWVLLPSGRKWWKRCGTQRAVEVLWMWRFTWHSLWATNGETWDGIDLNGSIYTLWLRQRTVREERQAPGCTTPWRILAKRNLPSMGISTPSKGDMMNVKPKHEMKLKMAGRQVPKLLCSSILRMRR